jgi:hypothetical protein
VSTGLSTGLKKDDQFLAMPIPLLRAGRKRFGVSRRLQMGVSKSLARRTRRERRTRQFFDGSIRRKPKARSTRCSDRFRCRRPRSS